MSTLTIDYSGRRYEAFEVSALLAEGVPQETVADAIATERLKTIKAECRKRIYAQASAETQMNMATAAAAVAGNAAFDRSAEEVALLTSTKAALDWVGAMRARVVALADDPEADFTLDASWPECPPELAVLTEQF